jgi:hypothetical protein
LPSFEEEGSQAVPPNDRLQAVSIVAHSGFEIAIAEEFPVILIRQDGPSGASPELCCVSA